MLKYYNSMVVFEEIPNEVTLAINIANCPCKCPSCHSKFLWGDVGQELTESVLYGLVEENMGITCVAFMGGDSEPSYVAYLASLLKGKYGNLKAAWYSGRDEVTEGMDISCLDYIKIGRYDEKCGPLNERTTNQVMYKVNNGKFEDITNLFWKK